MQSGSKKIFLIVGFALLLVVASAILLITKKSAPQIDQNKPRAETLLLTDTAQLAPRVEVSQDATNISAVPTVAISATPASIEYRGTPAVITWSATNATSCVDGDGKAMRLSGAMSITPMENYTLDILCTNSEGKTLKSVTVAVTRSPTISLFVYPQTIKPGEKSFVSWTTTNTTQCTDDSGKTLRLNDSLSITPQKSRTFEISCVGPDGKVKKSATISVVVPPPAPKVVLTPVKTLSSCSIRSSKNTVAPGEQFALVWTTSNISNPVMYQQSKGGGAVVIPASGSMLWTAEPNTSTVIQSDVFEIGEGGANAPYKPICSASVNVTPKPVAISPVPMVSISASPTSVVPGRRFSLTYYSLNATSCVALGNWAGARPTEGVFMEMVSTAGSYTYTLTCTGPGGTASNSATVTATAPAPVVAPVVVTSAPTVTISALPTSVVVGDTARSQLTYSSFNANSCTASGSWSGARSTGGGEPTGALTTVGSYTYTLTCTGVGGTASNSVVVTATAVTLAPTVTLTADKTTLPYGHVTSTTDSSVAKLSWSMAGATSCTPSSEFGAGTISGSTAWRSPELTLVPLSLSPNVAGWAYIYSNTPQTVTYSITCTGPGGATTASATVAWVEPPTPNPSIFTTPGTYSFTVPAGVTSMNIETWSGGGGAGSNTLSYNYDYSGSGTTGGGGGGSGYHSNKVVLVVPGSVLTVVVGAGGAGGKQGGWGGRPPAQTSGGAGGPTYVSIPVAGSGATYVTGGSGGRNYDVASTGGGANGIAYCSDYSVGGYLNIPKSYPYSANAYAAQGGHNGVTCKTGSPVGTAGGAAVVGVNGSAGAGGGLTAGQGAGTKGSNGKAVLWWSVTGTAN